MPCEGALDVSGTRLRSPSEAARTGCSALPQHTREWPVASVPKAGAAGTAPLLSPRHSPDREGELPRGALAVADQEGSEVIALEQPLLRQMPGDPARVPPARGTGMSHRHPRGCPSAPSAPCGVEAPRLPRGLHRAPHRAGTLPRQFFLSISLRVHRGIFGGHRGVLWARTAPTAATASCRLACDTALGPRFAACLLLLLLGPSWEQPFQVQSRQPSVPG